MERFSLKWLYLNSVTKRYCNLLILYFEITGSKIKQKKKDIGKNMSKLSIV